MDNKTLMIVCGLLAVIAVTLAVLYVLKPCPCAKEEYVDGFKIMTEKFISQQIIPIDYNQLNTIVANYTTCPAGIDCEVKDTKFINIYNTANYTEGDRLILMTKIANQLYLDMPFLYDRSLGFVFKAANNQDNIDTIYITSNQWSRR